MITAIRRYFARRRARVLLSQYRARPDGRCTLSFFHKANSR